MIMGSERLTIYVYTECFSHPGRENLRLITLLQPGKSSTSIFKCHQPDILLDKIVARLS